MKTLILFLFLAYLTYINGAKVKLTYYWVVREKDFKLGNDATLATCGSKSLAKVSKEFADRIAVEGSGYLRDDKTFLTLSDCVGEDNPCKPSGGKVYSCFEKGAVPVGNQDNPLAPFASVATNGFDFGTTGIIQEFVNKKTPKGETHNGCVRVDDSCSTCEEKNALDFYAYTKKNADYFEKNWKDSDERIQFTPKDCKVLKYKM